jgi:hypothetical protein
VGASPQPSYEAAGVGGHCMLEAGMAAGPATGPRLVSELKLSELKHLRASGVFYVKLVSTLRLCCNQLLPPCGPGKQCSDFCHHNIYQSFHVLLQGFLKCNAKPQVPAISAGDAWCSIMPALKGGATAHLPKRCQALSCCTATPAAMLRARHQPQLRLRWVPCPVGAHCQVEVPKLAPLLGPHAGACLQA